MRSGKTLIELLEEVLFFVLLFLTALFFWKKYNIAGIPGLILSFIVAGILYAAILAVLVGVSNLKQRQ